MRYAAIAAALAMSACSHLRSTGSEGVRQSSAAPPDTSSTSAAETRASTEQPADATAVHSGSASTHAGHPPDKSDSMPQPGAAPAQSGAPSATSSAASTPRSKSAVTKAPGSDTTASSNAPGVSPPGTRTGSPGGAASGAKLSTPADTTHSAATPPAGSAIRPAQPAAPSLDLASLEERLKDTRAIGVFTKLSLKNQVDDLLSQFRAFHAKKIPPLNELRQRYDLLLLKVLSLLQDGDPPLAAQISSSREALWDILTDPQKFGKL
jgi:hypothetical protein